MEWKWEWYYKVDEDKMRHIPISHEPELVVPLMVADERARPPEGVGGVVDD